VYREAAMSDHPQKSAFDGSLYAPARFPAACLGASVFAGALLGASSSIAATFPVVTDLSPYAVVSVGPHTSLTINSGPITGSVLVGDGSSVSTSGGGNGAITGGAFGDSLTLLSHFSGLQTLPSETLVSSTVTTDAFSEAAALQTFLDGLTATQTFGAFTNGQTITDSGAVAGLSVVDFTSLHDAALTLSGDANDIFVLRTAGDVHTNRTVTLAGGLTPDHIIWDLDGASGHVLQTSGGDQLFGTFLDTRGGDFQFSGLHLTGQLINTGGHIQFVSNSLMTGGSFRPPPVPEPANWILMLVGFAGIGLGLRSSRRQAVCEG
jgi:hypothetical protein